MTRSAPLSLDLPLHRKAETTPAHSSPKMSLSAPAAVGTYRDVAAKSAAIERCSSDVDYNLTFP